MMDFEAIIQQCKKPMAAFDKDFSIIYSNIYFKQLLRTDECHFVADLHQRSIDSEFVKQLISKSSQGKQLEFNLGDIYYCADLTVIHGTDNFFMIIDDITEAVRMRTNFNHQSQVLQTIVDAIPQYVCWKNEQSVFEGCNQLFAKSVNFMNTNQVIGLTDYSMPWKSIADKYVNDDEQVIDSQKPLIGYDEWQEAFDGTGKIMKVDKIPVITDDKTSIVCLYIDNTENYMLKKNVEEATLARNLSEKVMSDFILNMQHDIRTPLAGIVGLGDVILSMGVNEINEIHGAVQDMVNSASRLLTYCESMVDLKKTEEDITQSEPETVSIDELINGIIEIEKPAADAKGLLIETQADPAGIQCIVNKNIIERVLVNLVSNAIKFTDQGRILITAKLKRQDNSREALLRFRVVDPGIGIDHSDLDYVFQQFSKLKPSYRDSEGLTLGFGLRLAKKFVNELGGDLLLESEIGQGSTFTVDIPVILPLSYVYHIDDLD